MIIEGPNDRAKTKRYWEVKIQATEEDALSIHDHWKSGCSSMSSVVDLLHHHLDPLGKKHHLTTLT